MNNKLKIVGRVALVILFIGLLIVETGYLFAHQRYGIVWLSPWLKFGMVWSLIICVLLLLFTWTPIKEFKIILLAIGAVVTVGTLVMSIQAQYGQETYYSVSPDKKNIFYATLSDHQLTYYQTYYWALARPKETVEDVQQFGSVAWLTADAAALSYEKIDSTLHLYLGTYGYRGSAISYNYVTSLSRGYWQNDAVKLDNTSTGIVVDDGELTQTFAAEDVTQFGTIGVTLEKNSTTQYAYAISTKATYTAGESVPSNQTAVTLLLVKPSLQKMAVEELKFVRGE